MIVSQSNRMCVQSHTFVRPVGRTVLPRHRGDGVGRRSGVAVKYEVVDLNRVQGIVAGRVQSRDVRANAGPMLQSSAPSGKSGILFLAGANGQISLRLLRDLATAGFKVIAGVPDEAEAKIILDFGKRFELISRSVSENILVKEAAITDVQAMAEVIPKNARVVVVDNDGVGRTKTDPRAVGSVIEAAKQAGASQIVLLTPLQGGTGTSFVFFGQPSASAKGSARLSKLEQAVVDSGLDFTIVRVAGLAGVKEPADTKSLLVGPAGSYAPAAPAAPRELLGDLLSAVLTGGSTGSVLEVVPNTEAAEAAALEEQVAQAVSAYRATLAEAEKEEQERQAAAAAARGPAKPAAAEAAEAAPAKAKPAGLFGFGARKPAAPPAAPAPEPEPEPEAPKKKKPAPFFAFGAKPAAKQQAQQQEEAEEEAAAPPAKPAPFFAFGAKPKAKQPAEEPATPAKRAPPARAVPARKAGTMKQEVVPFFEEEKPAQKPGLPFFAFGAKKAQAKEEEEEEEPVPKRGGLFAARAAPAKSGTQKPGTQKVGTQKSGTQKAGTQKVGTQKSAGTQKGATQRGGSQKVQAAKKAPPARGSRKSSSSDEEEPPKKPGFKLFPL